VLWHFDELSEFARSDHGGFNATSDRVIRVGLAACRRLPFYALSTDIVTVRRAAPTSSGQIRRE